MRKGGSHSHRPYMSLKPLSHSRDPRVQVWTLAGLNHFSVALRLSSLLLIAMQDAGCFLAAARSPVHVCHEPGYPFAFHVWYAPSAPTLSRRPPTAPAASACVGYACGNSC